MVKCIFFIKYLFPRSKLEFDVMARDWRKNRATSSLVQPSVMRAIPLTRRAEVVNFTNKSSRPSSDLCNFRAKGEEWWERVVCLGTPQVLRGDINNVVSAS